MTLPGSIGSKEHKLILDLCEEIGYGRVMQIAADKWYELNPSAALTVGPPRTEQQVKEPPRFHKYISESLYDPVLPPTPFEESCNQLQAIILDIMTVMRERERIYQDALSGVK